MSAADVFTACRRPIVRGPRKGQSATGTLTGHARHVDAGEPICGECRAARTVYMAEYRDPPPPRPTEAERFWAKVEVGHPLGCWAWTASDNGAGYGFFRVGSLLDGTRRRVLAHRWSYSFLMGDPPAGLDLDHLCRNTLCVNPDHLEPVTRGENSRRGVRTYGERDAMAKLTWDAVGTIRQSEESSRALAERYGVSMSSIHNVKKGATWVRK